jgi:hypothetical protein
MTLTGFILFRIETNWWPCEHGNERAFCKSLKNFLVGWAAISFSRRILLHAVNYIVQSVSWSCRTKCRRQHVPNCLRATHSQSSQALSVNAFPCGGWGVELYRWESCCRQFWLFFSYNTDITARPLLCIAKLFYMFPQLKETYYYALQWMFIYVVWNVNYKNVLMSLTFWRWNFVIKLRGNKKV